MKWTQDTVLQLIEEYKKRPFLWDTSNEHYRTKQMKEGAWDDIAMLLGTNSVEVKKKMNSLLSSFRREKQRTFVKDGKEVIRSKWFAFERMLFLNDKIKSRHTQDFEVKIEHGNDEFDVEEKLFEDRDVDYDQQMPVEAIIHSDNQAVEGGSRGGFESPKSDALQKNRKSVDAETYEMVHDLGCRLKERDECSVYADHIANKLRSYDKRTRCIVEHHINNILFDADMGKYSSAKPEYGANS